LVGSTDQRKVLGDSFAGGLDVLAGMSKVVFSIGWAWPDPSARARAIDRVQMAIRSPERSASSA
jgi:hypothetical protein